MNGPSDNGTPRLLIVVESQCDFINFFGGFWDITQIYFITFTSFSATPNTGKVQAVVMQQKQSLLLCNNPNFPSTSSSSLLTSQPILKQEINTSLLSGSPAIEPDSRKRTRGVQSSILTAMALKEKRATLSEAKDIRKVHFFSLFSLLLSEP